MPLVMPDRRKHSSQSEANMRMISWLGVFESIMIAGTFLLLYSKIPVPGEFIAIMAAIPTGMLTFLTHDQRSTTVSGPDANVTTGDIKDTGAKEVIK